VSLRESCIRENRTCSLGGGRRPARRRASSDPTPMNHSNQGGQARAESEEGRPLIKENTPQPHTHPTQSGARVSQGLAGVRKAAREGKETKFTALLHRLTVDLLRESSYALKRKAAPGVEGVCGIGRYVGTFLAWAQLSDRWFGEGEVKFYLDGDSESPTICGTGTEDYVGGSYGFPEVYSTAYTGNTLKREEEDGPRKCSLYRWHIMDPVSFRRDLHVDIQALGWWPNHRYQPLADGIASVAYWYQSEHHPPFPTFPPLKARWPR